jgi:hypothetical protein
VEKVRVTVPSNRWLESVAARSDEVLVMLAPFSAYGRLVTGELRSDLGVLLRRPALFAVTLGSAVTFAATGRAAVTDLATTIFFWSFVPALQLALAAPFIALCRRPGLRLNSALDLFFAGQGPWLLWLLGVSASALVTLRFSQHTVLRMDLVLGSALVPLIWTSRILFAFCRVVLGLDKRRAFGWVMLYEATAWGAVYFYVGLVTFEFWPFGRTQI